MNQRAWNALSNKLLADKIFANKILTNQSALVIAVALQVAWTAPVCAQFDPEEIERSYQANDFAKVEAIAQARLLIDPYDVRARYYLASVLSKQKRGRQALVQYEACVKCGGSSALAQMAQKAIAALKIDEKKANPQYFEKAKAVPKGASGSSSSSSSSGASAGAGSGTNSGPGTNSGADSIADADTDPGTREAITLLRKDLADAIEVKRRRQSQDLEIVAEEEAAAIQEAAGTLSIHRDEDIEALRIEARAKRDKVYRLYKEEEDNITKAFQLRIEALKNSHRKAP